MTYVTLASLRRRFVRGALPAAMCGTVLAIAGCASSGSQGLPVASGTATTAPSATTAKPTATPTLDPLKLPTVSKGPLQYTFPIKASTQFGKYREGFPATDLFASCNSPVLAPIGGQIKDYIRKDNWLSSTDVSTDRPGISVTMVGPGNIRYIFSHLSAITPGIKPGVYVDSGTPIGSVGNTGNVRSEPCQLRMSITPSCGPLTWWLKPGGVSPYPYLQSWQSGGDSSPVDAVSKWRGSNGCNRSAHPSS